jgi:hypothetical protein
MIRLMLMLAAFVAVGPAHAYNLKQVARAELDAEECRVKNADGSRLAELLTLRRCTLLEELAKEKRKIYEDGRRRIAEDARR